MSGSESWSGEAAATASIDRRQLYDASARLYSVTFPLIWRYGFRSLHPWMSSRFAGCRAILDAGTGTGYWARHLARAEPRERVVGLDFSPEFIRLARRVTSGGEVEYVCADLTAAPFADGSFDGILCSGVLDTIPDPSAALEEFRRLLAPGGRVLLVVRGSGTRTSKLLERFFRVCVGASAACRERSLRPLRVPDSQWRRDGIFGKLPELAVAEGFGIEERDSPGLIGRAVLTRREVGPASRPEAAARTRRSG
jgi:SAM-dependent methyltransferase